MARAPIDAMIDRLDLRCTRCHTPRSVGCRCWETVKLRCPVCRRTKRTTREPGDVLVAGFVELKCPDCWAKEGTKP